MFEAPLDVATAECQTCQAALRSGCQSGQGTSASLARAALHPQLGGQQNKLDGHCTKQELQFTVHLFLYLDKLQFTSINSSAS